MDRKEVLEKMKQAGQQAAQAMGGGPATKADIKDLRDRLEAIEGMLKMIVDRIGLEEEGTDL